MTDADTVAPRAVLIDLDGVLYEGEQPVPGARDALRWLNTKGVPHLFLTNTTSRPREAVRTKLQRLGFEFAAEAILTPAIATRHWLQQADLHRVLPLVPEATLQDLGDQTLCAPGEPADAVIVGDLAERWDYALLNQAFRTLMLEPQPALVALGMTRYWRAEDGLRLDTAPFVHCLAHASGLQPLVLGKPAGSFFQAALQLLDVNADQALMIGDDIQADIGGAQTSGLQGMLVRTGKFRPADLECDIHPDHVLDSLADLPQWWP